MTINSIVQHDIASLLDGWIEAERNGIQFPVPFDLAWGIAGYSTKSNAKRKLISTKSQLLTEQDYLIRSDESSRDGRSSDLIQLTCDAFKQFCLLAETEKARQIRQYFIEAEKKWKLVQQVAPQVAQEVEILAMKIELAKIEMQRAAIEDKTISLRHYVVTALPKPIADRILGITEVKEIEYRDRVVKNNVVINGGGTINKTQICQRFGILTKNGKPDYPRLNRELESMNLPSSAWEEMDVVRTNRELKREYLDVLDRALYAAEQRQTWMGETP